MVDEVQNTGPGFAAGKYRSTQSYWYPTDPVVLVASAAAPNPQGAIRFEVDADFEATQMMVAADIAGAAQTDSTRVIPLVTLVITQSGGVTWMPAPIPLSLLMGDGRLPYLFPESIIVPANSSLAFQLARYAAAVDYNIRIALGGRKLYLRGQPG